MVRKLFFVLVWLSYLALAGASTISVYAQCNKCKKYQTVYAGHGPVSANDARRKLNIRIDPSWGSNTNSNVWNGIQGCQGCGQGALQLWNNVGSPYYFQLAQDPSQANSATDIVIRKGNPNAVSIYLPVTSDGCASTLWSPEGDEDSQVREITLPPEAANWSQETIACVVAHEIGHATGLSDVYDPTCHSIMNQMKPGKGCTECQTTTVQQTDADRSNQHAADKNNCTDASGAPANIIQVPTPTPSPTSTGGGSGCQSHFNTIDLYDDAGGSNCRYTFAVFTTYCNGYLTDYYFDLMSVENCDYGLLASKPRRPSELKRGRSTDSALETEIAERPSTQRNSASLAPGFTGGIAHFTFEQSIFPADDENTCSIFTTSQSFQIGTRPAGRPCL